METPTQSIIAVLEDGRQHVLAAVAGLTDATAAIKPAADRWSILECLEHVVAVEHRFLGFTDTGDTYEVPRMDPAREQQLATGIADRTTRREAPEAVVPTGRFRSVAEALAAFNEARDTSVRFAAAQSDRLYTIKAAHPRFGELNGVELLHLVNGHAVRHAAQMRETRDIVAPL